MRIAVISDTHMPETAKQIPKMLLQGIQGVDLILHAGDWTNHGVFKLFEKIAPVDGVAGNNDGPEIIKRFSRKKIIKVAGFRIGMIHGDGTRKTTEIRAWEAFSKEKVDAIIFGHSHTPFLKRYKGVLIFNPGSPTDKRLQPRYSYGIINLSETIQAEHFYYDDKS